MTDSKISKSAMVRLPVYLHYLNSLRCDPEATISSGAIAKAVGLGEVQVRKDLATVSGSGKPKIGYKVTELVGHLQEALDCSSMKKAVIVGAGRLGCALLSYEGFSEYNLCIKAAFDSDGEKAMTEINGKMVFPMSELESYCRDEDISIGIITVPEKQAQEVCDRLVKCGVKAIWSFAPAKLTVPDGIIIKEENMASSLAVLSASI